VIILRFIRRRYLVFKIISLNGLSIDRRALEKLIYNTFRELFGIVETVNFRLRLTYYNEEKHTGALSCPHVSVDKVRLALASIKDIDGKRVLIYVFKVTGTRHKAVTLCNSFSHPLYQTLKNLGLY